MRLVSPGHAFFAISMIALGVAGSVNLGFAPVLSFAPDGFPAHAFLIHLGLLIAVVSGVGLLFQRTAIVAARLLFVTLVLSLLLFRLPAFFLRSAFEACWTVFPLGLLLAANWVLYVWFAGEGDRKFCAVIAGRGGLCLARVLFGLCLFFFGFAHFYDVQDTLTLIPHWLPGHLFWVYFFGCTFIAAGLSILVGVWARLAAALAAFQIGLFLVLVWIPIVAKGTKVTFMWSETILNAALLAGAWVMCESYRRSSPTA